jgi:hypothetical protein
MPSEERELFGELASLVDGDYGKSAAAAGFPVDGEVFGIGLDRM